MIKNNFSLKENPDFKNIVEVLNDGILVFDKNYRIIYLNKFITDMTGFEKNELLGEKIFSFIKKKNNNKFNKSQIKSIIRVKKEYDFIFLKKNKTKIYFKTRLSPLFNKNGNNIGTAAQIKNIIKDKKDKIKIISKNNLNIFQTIISGISHDINNPNNYILLNSNILIKIWSEIKIILEKEIENKNFKIFGMKFEELSKSIEEIINSFAEGSQKINSIIRNLSDYVCSDEKDHDEILNINEVLKSVLILLNNIIKKSTSNFSVDYGSNIPIIKGNNKEIKECIIKILISLCEEIKTQKYSLTIKTIFNNNKIILLISADKKNNKKEIMKNFFDTVNEEKIIKIDTKSKFYESSQILKNIKGEIVIIPGTKSKDIYIKIPSI